MGEIMNRKKHAILLAALAGAATLVAGCGSKAYREASTANAPGAVGGVPGSTPGSTVNYPSGSVTPTPTATPCQGTPAATFAFSLAGSGTQGSVPSTVTINVGRTDSLLQIKVKPGPSDRLSLPGGQYSNAAFALSYAAYDVEVNGRRVSTNALLLDNAYPWSPGSNPQTGQPAANPAREQIIDFSDRVQNMPPNSDITVTISHPRYDVYCKYLIAGLINPQYYQTYCSGSLYNVYMNHVIGGSIEARTNGTCFAQ